MLTKKRQKNCKHAKNFLKRHRKKRSFNSGIVYEKKLKFGRIQDLIFWYAISKVIQRWLSSTRIRLNATWLDFNSNLCLILTLIQTSTNAGVSTNLRITRIFPLLNKSRMDSVCCSDFWHLLVFSCVFIWILESVFSCTRAKVPQFLTKKLKYITNYHRIRNANYILTTCSDLDLSQIIR